MITGKHIAETAIESGLLGTPYSKLDCQAFVEEVLKKAGLKIINYRGSNHMWRSLVYDRKNLNKNDLLAAPAGSLAFIVRDDGGEVRRGYHDDMGNATHVAIVLGDGRVMESTTGGVQYGNLSRFTDYGLIMDVDYDVKGGTNNAGEGSTLKDALEAIKSCLVIIKDNITRLEEFVDDLYRGA